LRIGLLTSRAKRIVNGNPDTTGSDVGLGGTKFG
jgi:hypothetical protein